jgi:hypothetical protein
MGISCNDCIHELRHSRISIGCKYIEVGVGLFCTRFLFHSRLSIVYLVNEADCFIVCRSQVIHEQRASLY